MKKYKLIAMDIDGTILNDQHQLSSKLKIVLNELAQQGVLAVLVSARPAQSVALIAEELGVGSHLVALNGSLVVNAGEIVFSHQFELSLILGMLQPFMTDQLLINCYSEFNWYVNQFNDYVQREAQYIKIEPQLIDLAELKRVNKVTLNAPQHILELIKQQLQKIQQISVSFSSPGYLEIQCHQSSKAHGLRELASSYAISLQQSIAFGDGENDIPMLQECGLGIAMGNSLAHIQQAAHHVTATNQEEGVALFLIKAQQQGLF